MTLRRERYPKGWTLGDDPPEVDFIPINPETLAKEKLRANLRAFMRAEENKVTHEELVSAMRDLIRLLKLVL